MSTYKRIIMLIITIEISMIRMMMARLSLPDFFGPVRNAGSIPNGEPYYHTEGDTAEKVDFENSKRVVQLTLAAILHLDAFGRP